MKPFLTLLASSILLVAHGAAAHGVDASNASASAAPLGGSYCEDGLHADLKQDLERHLDAYNKVRVDVGPMLRQVSIEYEIAEDEREDLRNFATTLDKLADRVPHPDPYREEFKEFDFTVGLTLAAVAVYLGSHDALAEQFDRGRDDPESTVGRYLNRLERHRVAYETSLDAWEESRNGTEVACN